MDRRHFMALLTGAVPSGAALGLSFPTAMGARERAHRYLVNAQGTDGAWRSAVYGAFKSGEALTPLVLRAVGPDRPTVAQRAVGFILDRGEACWSSFPVHNGSWLLQGMAHQPLLEPLRDTLVTHLRNLQLAPSRGWREDHPAYGGWSYAGEAPSWRPGTSLAPMQQPNLSATVLAVAGLRAAGVGADDPSMQAAAGFIRRCQNHASGAGAPEFDDGGFFQIADDVSRNKAGKVGADRDGRTRFKSYFSASADGLRGLILTGTKPGDPRVTAALAWMRKHPSLADVPDLACYSAYARSEARKLLGIRAGELLSPDTRTERDNSNWDLAPDLPLAQNANGSFVNPAGEMRENDPLVATALILMAAA